jgi:hypothetical protein
LVVEGNVNEGVESDNRFEAAGFAVLGSHIGLHEVGSRDEPTRTFDLYRRDVEAGHVETAVHQDAGGRYPGPASEVQDPGCVWEQAAELI